MFSHREGVSNLTLGSALDCYASWPSPVAIISDGAYGINGFEGDPDTEAELVDWYEPHVRAWSDQVTSQTTLWFWNTEVGWATVHPLLISHGWVYNQLVVWDKGIGHIANNVNSKTIRSLPVVTEVCARYTRPMVFLSGDTEIDLQTWIRSEWDRTGLSRREANTACGVKEAATRKYFGTDRQWYAPPPEVFEKLSDYANTHGIPEGRPYFDLGDDFKQARSESTLQRESKWGKIRAKWNHQHGLTNVWTSPAVRGSERINFEGAGFHPNQKPLSLMERQIQLSTDEGDVIWEPFGGLCTASFAAARLGRDSYAAEITKSVYDVASARLGRPSDLTYGPSVLDLFGI